MLVVYRDWVVTVDVRTGRIVDGVDYRWSTSKLNKNELMVLVGHGNMDATVRHDLFIQPQ